MIIDDIPLAIGQTVFYHEILPKSERYKYVEVRDINEPATAVKIMLYIGKKDKVCGKTLWVSASLIHRKDLKAQKELADKAQLAAEEAAEEKKKQKAHTNYGNKNKNNNDWN